MDVNAGVDPGFQVRGAHLKQFRRAEGGAKIVGVFRVKNHIYSNFRGASEDDSWDMHYPTGSSGSRYVIYYHMS
jgi:hypothetical protein